MECTDFFKNPVPPLIHGEFDNASERDTEPLDKEKNIYVQKMSAAELNFRSDIFSSTQSSSTRIDSQVLSKAAKSFLDEKILGQSFEEYCEAVSRTSQISVNTAKASANHLADALRNVSKRAQASRRKNSFFFDELNGLCSPTYGFIHVRKGNSIFISLPGNSPGPNSVWLEALLYGYEVILRPSFRDVFTPLRLAICLINSGVPRSSLSVIFCDYLGHNTLVERADLSLIFGGSSLESKYQGSPNVKVYGPGRSVTVLDPELYTAKVGNDIINSAIESGGVACFNTSLLLLTQSFDNFEQTFITDLVSVMDKRKFIGQDDRPTLLKKTYQDLITQALINKDAKIVYDGSTSVNETEVRAGPLVYTRKHPIASQTILEFPFPAIEVSSLNGADIEKVVNKSLSTAIYSNDSGLIYKVFHCRPGGRVLINTNRTADFDRLPHDGHLSDFLLTERPFVKSLD